MLIYMIRSKCGSHIYIGSCVDLDERIRCHIKDSSNPKWKAYNTKKYKIIRDNGGWTNFEFKIIDVVTTADKSVLKHCEQYYIDKFDAKNSMNTLGSVDKNERRVREEYIREYNLKNREWRNNYQRNYKRWKTISQTFREIEPIYP